MRVWIYLLRKGAYRDILNFKYHLKAHTISNMLVIKVSAQNKGGGGGGGGGGGVKTATNMCSNFGGKWDSPPSFVISQLPKFRFLLATPNNLFHSLSAVFSSEVDCVLSPVNFSEFTMHSMKI